MKYLKLALHWLSVAITWLLVLPIRFYQKFITPYTPPSCRFTPTCSEYARQALLKYGADKRDWDWPSGESSDAILGVVPDMTRCHSLQDIRDVQIDFKIINNNHINDKEFC
jgi:hypothetical protein